jgi:2-polyprenyl-3-methyl-5-hydroxy-6-metoxy-1,4-benzoquinol methylase
MSTTSDTGVDVATRDAFVEKMFQACLGVFDVAGAYLGLQLGLYRSLADDGPATARELATRTRSYERYVREWLEQQVVTGVLAVDDATVEAALRRYSLPEAHEEVLLNPDALAFMGPYPGQVIASLVPLPALMRAFREGGGVPYEVFGADCRDGIAAGNRVSFINLLGSQWFPAIPALDARLRADPPARVADIGCGYGWSSISIARAYPKVRVDGFDLDASSIDAARRHARDADLSEQVTFELRDAAELPPSHDYDLVVAFETIHDMSDPVRALGAMRGLVATSGTALVADERVGEEFSTDPGDIERLYYGFSLLHCLPAGMAQQPSVGTGTVMRPAMLRGYVRKAGFRDIEILPIEHDFWRFYRLVP